jgi:hypothetical protein
MRFRHLSFLAAFLACTSALHAVRPHSADADNSDAPAKTDAPATNGAPAKADAKANAGTKANAKGDAKAEASSAKSDTPPYELKNRSAFAVTGEKSRPPFWPIGWVHRTANAPAQAQEAPAAPKILLDEKSFVLTSIMLGSGTTPSLALINKRAYSEGEFLRMPKTPGETPLRVRVMRITDGAVTLQSGAQTLIVPLQRMELSNKRAEEQYLDPDR